MIGKGRKKSKKQQMDLEKWVKKPQKKAKKVETTKYLL